MVRKCKLITKLFSVLSIFIVSGCSSMGDFTTLESYPKSGNYTGSAYSRSNGAISTAKGSIIDGSAKFELTTGIVDRQSNTVKTINATLWGRIQLGSQICFSGNEEINGVTTAFIVFNCKAYKDNISGSYKSNLGDYGDLSVSLN